MKEAVLIAKFRHLEKELKDQKELNTMLIQEVMNLRNEVQRIGYLSIGTNEILNKMDGYEAAKELHLKELEDEKKQEEVDMEGDATGEPKKEETTNGNSDK